MKIVCDADGLIKLAKAGLLASLTVHVTLIVGEVVYSEAVTAGIARGHRDAFELEKTLAEHGAQLVSAAESHGGDGMPNGKELLGRGEAEALFLYKEHQAHAVLSDDRAFLRLLEDEKIPYLTPASACVMLAEQGAMTGNRALRALDDLRPLIREDQYWAARQDLEGLAQGGEAL